LSNARASRPPTVHLITLGCPKNQVDSEGMSALLTAAGYNVATEARKADVVIVNTCGFIAAAEDESRQVIADAIRSKKPRQLLVLAGCMVERRGAALAAAFPGVDGVIGTNRWAEIAVYLEGLRRGEPGYWLGPSREMPSVSRVASGASAYLKISDGCDVGCAFCTIPLFKGGHRSKPADRIVREARDLAETGAREIILIGQDTTAWGSDLGERDALAGLLERICREVPDLPWIRLMYGFPSRITPRLIEVMAREPRIVKYIDLPLQHASREVLARMGRPRKDLREVIARLREGVPGIAIRSTFIVGFPGETEAEFGELLAFLQEVQLDRVGVFAYSAEEGTRAAGMPDQVPDRLKRKRLDRAMKLQQGISLARNRAHIGQTLAVLIEGQVVDEPGAAPAPFAFVGRSYRDAPEVDGLVFVKGGGKGDANGGVAAGQIVEVRVTEALDYDLVGEVVRT
jgi:ribosomal protein S12 methylthiotransferase